MRNLLRTARRFFTMPGTAWRLSCALLVLLIASGCGSTPKDPPFSPETGIRTVPPEPLLIREGDVLTITFPGAPTLNANQQVRRDGKITLGLVGEVAAAGKTVAELEKELVKLYDSQLVSKEVTVSVQSSTFAIYVTGTVMRPGKITTDRPITAVQAIMEAGVDHTRANLKAVRVVRTLTGKTEYFTLNVRDVLIGKEVSQFWLKPGDIVYIPERFSPF
jgi:polysaccharide export outer membrane protein